MKVINQKTLVPISAALILIGGGAFWLSSLQAMALANKETVQHIMHKQDSYNEYIMDIQKDIAQIKGELKRIRK